MPYRNVRAISVIGTTDRSTFTCCRVSRNVKAERGSLIRAFTFALTDRTNAGETV